MEIGHAVALGPAAGSTDIGHAVALGPVDIGTSGAAAD